MAKDAVLLGEARNQLAELTARAGVAAQLELGELVAVAPDGRITLTHAALARRKEVREAILAHEVAHLALGHLRTRKRLASSLVVPAAAGLGVVLRETGAASGVPLALLLAAVASDMFVLGPLLSRRSEHAADALAAQWTSPEALAEALRATVRFVPFPPQSPERTGTVAALAQALRALLARLELLTATHPLTSRRLARLAGASPSFPPARVRRARGESSTSAQTRRERAAAGETSPTSPEAIS